ncbi:PaaI family thioesterase [Staphylococcus massiliensis]|uniref:PaaI family thioesterase n=1 Tax=Staphylococcus massiliensis TaxID=555791 RepID=UPI001EE02151|nr:PaaI family thioesterase [Staphylococcus massiliensis]MCG3401652.1 PaaI family thioesterase [Staphylococcus massiliensis]
MDFLKAFQIEVVEQESGYIKLKMPITDMAKQPFGYLHGGVSMALGETACSMGSLNMIDSNQFIPLGQEMNANHIKSEREGYIYCTARIIHEGCTQHIWDIQIMNEASELLCVMRGTIMIKPLRKGQ